MNAVSKSNSDSDVQTESSVSKSYYPQNSSGVGCRCPLQKPAVTIDASPRDLESRVNYVKDFDLMRLGTHRSKTIILKKKIIPTSQYFGNK